MFFRRSAFLILLVSLISGILGYTHTLHTRELDSELIVMPGPWKSTVTLSKSVFPASRVCRNPPYVMGNCNEPTVDSFVLSYRVGKNASFDEFGSLRITHGYLYDGEYQTTVRQAKPSAWALPNIVNRDAYNYVRAEVLENGGRYDSFRPVIRVNEYTRAIDLRFHRAVNPGALIRIHFGNPDGKGYVIPPVAYDVDLVVLIDPENDGIFEPIDAPMPILSIVGTELDRFQIIAPSTPGEHEFTIIVQALQGEDTRNTNMYLVRDYAGTIRFTSTDKHAMLPDDYTFTMADNGVHQFTVALSKLGIHNIFVEDVSSKQRGKSNPIRVEEHEEEDEDEDEEGKGNGTQKEKEKRKDYRLYWGALHQHTNIGGHGQQTPQFALNYAQNVAGLDFLALTEHCGPPQVDFRYTWGVVNEAYQPNEFVTFPGFEWASRNYGHRNIVYFDSSGEQTWCDRPGTPDVDVVAELDDLLDILDRRRALAIPHHSAWRYSPLLRGPDDDFVLGDINSTSQRLFEIYSHHGSSELYDNAPYEIHFDKQHEWDNPDKLAYFQNAIAAGYKFGVVAGTDDHLGKPGGNVSWGPNRPGNGNYPRNGLTGVYAENLTREGIWEALNARRTYGTTGARIIVDFSIKKHHMGEEVIIGGHPKLRINVIGTDDIDRIEIMRNGTETIHTHWPKSHEAKFSYTDKKTRKGKEYSYYVRVIQKDEHMAWSSPIWVTREKRHDALIASSRADLPDVADALEQNVPNPFNIATSIAYSISRTGQVSLRIYDVSGRLVRTLVDEVLSPQVGGYRSTWRGRSDAGNIVPSGVYFYKLIADDYVETRKMALIK